VTAFDALRELVASLDEAVIGFWDNDRKTRHDAPALSVATRLPPGDNASADPDPRMKIKRENFAMAETCRRLSRT